jgi:hypothetical protein
VTELRLEARSFGVENDLSHARCRRLRTAGGGRLAAAHATEIFVARDPLPGAHCPSMTARFRALTTSRWVSSLR